MTIYVLYRTLALMANGQSRLLIEVESNKPADQLTHREFTNLCEAKINELYEAGQIDHKEWMPFQVFKSVPASFVGDDDIAIIYA
jgi:hypothetical protein